MNRFLFLIPILLITSCLSVTKNTTVANFKVGSEINDTLYVKKNYSQIINGIIEETTFTYTLIEHVSCNNNKIVNTLSLDNKPSMMNDIGLFDLNIYHKSKGEYTKANDYNTLLSLVESSYIYDYEDNTFLLTDWEGETIKKIKAINRFFSWEKVNLPSIDIDKSSEYMIKNTNSTKYIFQLQYDLLNNQQFFENKSYYKTILFYYSPTNFFLPIKCKILMKKLSIDNQYYFFIVNENTETVFLNGTKFKPSINIEFHTSSNLKLYKLTSNFSLYNFNTPAILYREKIEILNNYR